MQGVRYIECVLEENSMQIPPFYILFEFCDDIYRPTCTFIMYTVLTKA